MNSPNSKEPLEALLSRQGDPDLTVEEARILAELLEDDAHLASADRYEKLNRELRDLGRRPLPVDWDRFRAVLRDRINEERRPSQILRLSKWLGPLAAAACIGVVGLLYWNTVGTTQLAKGPTAPTEAVMRVAYHRIAEQAVPGSEQVLAVNITRTPPSGSWRAGATSRKPTRVIAVCGPDPLGPVDPSFENPVF